MEESLGKKSCPFFLAITTSRTLPPLNVSSFFIQQDPQAKQLLSDLQDAGTESAADLSAGMTQIVKRGITDRTHWDEIRAVGIVPVNTVSIIPRYGFNNLGVDPGRSELTCPFAIEPVIHYDFRKKLRRDREETSRNESPGCGKIRTGVQVRLKRY